jgi:hypothetical protein
VASDSFGSRELEGISLYSPTKSGELLLVSRPVGRFTSTRTPCTVFEISGFEWIYHKDPFLDVDFLSVLLRDLPVGWPALIIAGRRCLAQP